ncbi:MAG: YitT family protein [Clostridia bacterium]|nr:YitT family protein [Clostridia bacterium]
MKTIFSVVLGSAIMALGLDLFLIPEQIVVGGISGIATVLQFTAGISPSVTVLVLNIPITILAFLYLSRRTFWFTMLGSLNLSVFLQIFTCVAPVSDDKILCSLAGGVLVGLGLGIVFRADGTTGGTDVVAKLLQKKKPYLPIGILMLVADGVVVLLSGVLLKSYEQMIYASIALFVSTKVIDRIVVGGDAAKQVTIISTFAPDIARCVITKLQRGVTGIKSVGLYSGKDTLMLMTVVQNNQIVKVKQIVKKYDKNAFVIISNVSEVIGEGFNK